MSKRFSSNKKMIILYEDDQYIVFYKPAGLLAVPTDRQDGKDISLDAIANEEFKRRPELQSKEIPRLHPCHRLDRETSGVIIFAKGKTAQQAMMDLFHKKEVHKKYIAFLYGRLDRGSGVIRMPIKDAFSNKYAPDASPKEAITKYRLIEQRKRFAIVEAIPVTGRTNQLRIHFKEIGHPIVGENKYIFRKDMDLKFKRTALHAASIEFKQPITGEKILVDAPLSTDMKNFLERNRQ